MIGWLEKLSEKWRVAKSKKRIEIAAAAGVILLALAMLIASFLQPEAKARAEPAPSGRQWDIDTVEARLADTLSAIRGAGKVKVMLTYASAPEVVPAMQTGKQVADTTEQGRETTRQSITTNENSQPVTVSGEDGNRALVVTERQPEITGVIVVAEGGADVRVRLELTRAVQTVLGLSADKVDVFPMEHSED